MKKWQSWEVFIILFEFHVILSYDIICSYSKFSHFIFNFLWFYLLYSRITIRFIEEFYYKPQNNNIEDFSKLRHFLMIMISPKIIRLLSSIGNISIMTLLEHSYWAFIAFISIQNYLYRLNLVGKSNWEQNRLSLDKSICGICYWQVHFILINSITLS